ncbi:MAG: phage tail length tape measure family protein [Gammaproteobacteria bacterium]|nr:phage tail length tape measure family protein [Gammaproteobacteria bacterium]
MANPVLQFLITAKDEATSTLSKIGGALSQLGGVVTGVAKSAIHLVFPDFGDSVRAAEALEIQMGKLRAGIEATGGTAGLTAEEIDEMARRLDEATLGSAEGFRNAAVELLTFKSVGKDAFERTLKAAQDLADAGFGTVESATVQLGKALEDPVKGLTSLTRVGVSFTDQQRAMIEGFIQLGDAASAQNVILAAVEGQVQGVASAAGGGLAGAVDLVGKRLTDLKETVGAVLTPVLTKLNLVWADVIGAVQKAGAEIAGPLASNTEQAGQALKAFGDSIGQFLSQTIRDLGQWIASLDWRAIQTGARQVGENLSELAKGFTAFGSVAGQVIKGVTVGVNAVQVAFHAVVGGVQGLVGRFLSGLAAVEEQAAQVGLGSLEHANELRAEAERWKRDAAESIEAVGKNAAEGVEAFKRLTGATDDAARAQQGVKDNLPTAELQTLTKTLDDYRAIAERANHAAEQARKDFEAGKISAAEYGQKLTAAAEANHQLAVETHKQTESLQKNTEAAEASAKAKETLRTQETTLLDLAAKFRAAQQDAADAAVEEARAALELAQAKGDERAAREAALLVAQRAVEAAQATQVAQQAELQILESQRRQLIETAGGLDRLTAAQRLELGQIEQTIQAKQRDIATSDTKIQTQQREADQAAKMAGPIGQLIRLYDQKAAAASREVGQIERSYDAKLRDIDAEIDQADAKGDTARASELKAERAQLEADAARETADAVARQNQAEIEGLEAKKLSIQAADISAEAKAAEIEQIDESIARLKAETEEKEAAAQAAQRLADEEEKAGEASEKAGHQFEQSGRNAAATSVFYSVLSDAATEALSALSGLSFGGLASLTEQHRKLDDELKIQAERVRQNTAIFYAGATATSAMKLEVLKKTQVLLDYANSLEKTSDLLATLNKKTQEGTITTQDLALATKEVETGLKYLDEEHLDELRAALQDAQDKMDELQETTQSAKDRLTELNAELLEAQGFDQKAELLRQQLDYTQQLADIEAQRQQAEATGQRELITILDQQRRVLDDIHRTKIANIQADAEAQAAASQTPRTSAPRVAETAANRASRIYQLDLTFGQQRLSATTTADPQAFLDELQRAQRSST